MSADGARNPKYVPYANSLKGRIKKKKEKKKELKKQGNRKR